jgi:hypothetical protein
MRYFGLLYRFRPSHNFYTLIEDALVDNKNKFN